MLKFSAEKYWKIHVTYLEHCSTVSKTNAIKKRYNIHTFLAFDSRKRGKIKATCRSIAVCQCCWGKTALFLLTVNFLLFLYFYVRLKETL